MVGVGAARGARMVGNEFQPEREHSNVLSRAALLDLTHATGRFLVCVVSLARPANARYRVMVVWTAVRRRHRGLASGLTIGPIFLACHARGRRTGANNGGTSTVSVIAMGMVFWITFAMPVLIGEPMSPCPARTASGGPPALGSVGVGCRSQTILLSAPGRLRCSMPNLKALLAASAWTLLTALITTRSARTTVLPAPVPSAIFRKCLVLWCQQGQKKRQRKWHWQWLQRECQVPTQAHQRRPYVVRVVSSFELAGPRALMRGSKYELTHCVHKEAH